MSIDKELREIYLEITNTPYDVDEEYFRLKELKEIDDSLYDLELKMVELLDKSEEEN